MSEERKKAQTKTLLKKRKAAESWNKKIADASKMPVQSMSNQSPNKMKQCWDKDAINGRIKLAEFWDQRIINLMDAIENGDARLGAPETLTGGLQGWMARRISKNHRLVYKVETIDGQQTIHVKECGGHYVR